MAQRPALKDYKDFRAHLHDQILMTIDELSALLFARLYSGMNRSVDNKRLNTLKSVIEATVEIDKQLKLKK